MNKGLGEGDDDFNSSIYKISCASEQIFEIISKSKIPIQKINQKKKKNYIEKNKKPISVK